jgi:catechol 2,3-dioxygenase-like lactoylglutathione lyase family enzyme
VSTTFSHVGISVANLERSMVFYRDLLGMKVVEEVTFKGEKYEAILGLKGARGRIAILKSGTLAVELFEFVEPVPKASDSARPVCDHGITHLAIEVDDIAALYARLKAAGVGFHCPPLHFPECATATYARDPDGNVVEMLQPVAPGPERTIESA